MTMKYYFIGIGGIGMSSLAMYFHYFGEEISGSNAEENERVVYLKNKGIKVYLDKTNEGERDLLNSDIIIRTSAVRDDHPEVKEAIKFGIPVLNRMEMLNYVLKRNWSFGVSGTDGKTTTTAMLSKIFIDSGRDPTVFLGGIHNSLEDGNFRLGTGKVVAEVDESDGYIKNTIVDVAILTNLREDHLDHYEDSFVLLEEAIRKFAYSARDFSVLNADDPIISTWNIPYSISYGKSEKALYRFDNRKALNKHQKFDVYYKDKYIGSITLPLPGEHYVYDAMAAISTSLEIGINFDQIKESLKSFKNVGRRFDILYSNTHLHIIDDYAHTPEEIEATIRATKEFFGNSNKIIAIFQPHRYTRLKRQEKRFIKVLKEADEVYVYRLYSAYEIPNTNISEKLIVKYLESSGKKSKFYDEEDLLLNDLMQIKEGVLLFLGAGDITDIAWKLSEMVKHYYYHIT